MRTETDVGLLQNDNNYSSFQENVIYAFTPDGTNKGLRRVRSRYTKLVWEVSNFAIRKLPAGSRSKKEKYGKESATKPFAHG